MGQIIPAPWQLKGAGYIVIFRFAPNRVIKEGWAPPQLAGQFKGGLTTVMLVDYQESTAGPYRELLFIPGRFDRSEGSPYTITKIYVSTTVSVLSGRANWGIPKELARFDWQDIGNRSELITIKKDDSPVLTIQLRSGRFSFPVTTRLLPLPLAQDMDGRLYRTSFSGHGTGRLAKIERLSVEQNLFPDFSSGTPCIAIRVDDFRLRFPVARIEDIP